MVTFEKNNTPTIHYTVRKPIAFQHRVNPEILLFDKKNTLQNITEEVLRVGIPYLKLSLDARVSITDVYCMLGSPWYISKMHVLKIEKPDEFSVTERDIAALISEQEVAFKKTFKKEGDTGTDSLIVIEKKIVNTKVNGYEVNNVYLKKARTLELSLFMSAVEQRVLKHIRSVLNPAFSFRKLYFHSFPLAYFTVTRDIFHDLSDFLIVDVRGEITDVSLIQKNALSETVSFPLGRHFIMRKICETLRLTPEVGASFIKLFNQGKTDGRTKNEIEAILSEAEGDWRATFRSATLDLGRHSLLPSRAYLITDFDFGSLIAGWMAREKIDRLGISTEQFTVEYLNDEKMAGHLSWSKRAKHDAFLAVGALFLNKLDNL